MKIVSAGIASLAVGLAMPADAQLLAHKDLSLATALTIATTAADTCKGQGYRVSVSVVGRTGEPPQTSANAGRLREKLVRGGPARARAISLVQRRRVSRA